MNKATVTVLTLWLLAVGSTTAWGQGVLSQQGIVKLAPLYQSWDVDGSSSFSEFTLPLYIYYPVNKRLSFTLRGNQSSASGDNLETLAGVTDTQIGLNYYLENPNIVFNLGFNLPTGQSELSFSKFQTSALISQNIFNMHIPNFGQGLNVTAGFTWALPLTETLVLGVGGAYQIKGGFKPLEGFVEDYKPGNEILLTGGFDVRVGPTSSFSGDVTFTLYNSDKIGSDEVFAIGNKLVLNAQFRQFFGFNELRFNARFRGRAKNEQAIILGQQLQTEPERTFPNQFELHGQYRVRINPSLHLRGHAEARFYEQTAATFSGVTLFGGGLVPEISLARNLILPITLKYFAGSSKDGPSLSGFEIGVGLSFLF